MKTFDEFKDEIFETELTHFLQRHAYGELINFISNVVYNLAEYQYASNDFDFTITEDDPLLKLCLNNSIPDGCKRNAVVLKNLAPILVRLGLDTNEEIKRKIISNMPNKTLGELEGWLKKARGENLHLNIFEVNK